MQGYSQSISSPSSPNLFTVSVADTANLFLPSSLAAASEKPPAPHPPMDRIILHSGFSFLIRTHSSSKQSGA